jgi:CheY-like chemotaxis protein
MPAPKILVVDDQPINVQLLKRKLERENLHILPAYSGKEALDVVAAEKPDLILLDVMMPDMDGIEVCQRLQANEATRSIPVIFITARSSKEGKLEGLGVGAVDYITKPIDLDETLARVQTQLRFVAINREMVDLQRRLVEARRAATIGAVTQGIAHNLNNLLGVVIGYLDLIKVYHDQPDQVSRNVQHVEEAVQRIVSIIKQLSSLVIKTRLPSTKFKLSALLNGAFERYYQDYRISQPVVVDNPLGDLEIDTHVEVFEDVLVKILINAWEAYDPKPPGERIITVRTAIVERAPEGKMVEVRVEDKGKGIDPEIRDHMFEPFISTKHTVGVGMGLTVARHSLRNMWGELTLEDRPGGGTVAVMQHPIERRKKKNAD